MGDDEMFTEWIEKSNQDAEFKSAVYKLLENYKETLEALHKQVRYDNSKIAVEVLQKIGEF